MPTISQIVYDKRTKKYRVRMASGSGVVIESTIEFDTAVDAEAWLDAQLKNIGADLGEPMPLRKQ
jgi:hypothetical protein